MIHKFIYVCLRMYVDDFLLLPTDINECLRGICQPQQQCKNTLGSYQCVDNCLAGTVRSESGGCNGEYSYEVYIFCSK